VSAESVGNGHARFDDLRSEVSEHYGQISRLEIEAARVETRLAAVEKAIERMASLVERMRDEDLPHRQRERSMVSIQIVTAAAALLSLLLPMLRH
jgi:septal ring factor EnvC (AmiA/AmiB activator)